MIKRDYRTRYKLDEAAYFLDKMKRYYDSWTEFGYYLSAFLSASRSVFYFMHAEYCKVQGFKQWEKKNIISSKIFIDPDLEFLKSKRSENIHQKNVSMKATMKIPISFKPSIEELRELRSKNLPTPSQQMVRGSPTRINTYFQDKEDVEVLDFCVSVHQKIVSLVRDCEKEFKIY